jgi:hypothetical protein
VSLMSYVRVRPHRKRAAAVGRPLWEIGAVCDLVTPDRAQQPRAVQGEESYLVRATK